MNYMLIDECFGLIGEIRKVGAANQTLFLNVELLIFPSPFFPARVI
jgi:hypothetical protein